VQAQGAGGVERGGEDAPEDRHPGEFDVAAGARHPGDLRAVNRDVVRAVLVAVDDPEAARPLEEVIARWGAPQ